MQEVSAASGYDKLTTHIKVAAAVVVVQEVSASGTMLRHIIEAAAEAGVKAGGQARALLCTHGRQSRAEQGRQQGRLVCFAPSLVVVVQEVSASSMFLRLVLLQLRQMMS